METLWATEQNFLERYLQTREDITAEERTQARAEFSDTELADILSIDGDTATISINGVLTPNGPDAFDRFFGIEGTSTNMIRAAAEKLTADDTVKQVILKMNTPGGLVTGTDETFQALSLLRDSGKEIIAENHGMIASAGIWIAMAANLIVGMSPTSESGSIGVIIAGFDFSERMKQFGVKQVIIVSKNAPNKAASLETEKGIGILQKLINDVETVFISRVATGRGVSVKKVADDFGQGGLLLAEEAQQVGLIDKVVAPIGQPIVNTKNKTETKTQKHEESNMDFTQYLSENAGARLEVKALKEEAFAEGQAVEKADVAARIAVAKPILESAEYPDQMKKLAAQCVAGELTKGEFTAAIAVYDATATKADSSEAAKESDKIGDSPADQADLSKEDGGKPGEITSQADIDAEKGATAPVKEGE